MSRKLPVYLLIDSSGSMNGEPINSVNEGLRAMMNALRQDPYALETVLLSVITFDREVKEVFTLTPIVAITLGNGADTSVLKQLTPHVLIYEGSGDDDFRKFVDWISNSVKTQSQKADAGKGSDGIDLTKVGDKLSFAQTDQHSQTDPNTVILTGRCKTKKQPYLMKYSRMATLQSFDKYNQNLQYNLEGCFPITEDYFNWSSESEVNEMEASALLGTPGCPHCGNPVAFAVCGLCEKIMCIEGEGKAICPWCDNENNFASGSGDFSVKRGQG
ncbi:MAG: TerY-C metal binding domain-containing protein [Sulfurovum sp.]|nr:TerY-C metal binding domain-containing protein [Sulfurovum sp.]